MCGITGFWSFGGGNAESMRDVATRMASRIAHRGPDDAATFVDADAGIAFGFRRLAIIDLSAAGGQPMTSASGRYTIIFNGEIFNFERLRARLPPQPWRGHSDTEVLLACVEAWGLERAVQEFIGMFAFALWDAREQTLSLVRDRAGVKPLYFARTKTSLLFGSEIKALAMHPEFDRTIDDEAARLYAQFRYVPAPRSIYRDVKKLDPASILTITRDGAMHATRYWTLRAEPFAGSEADAMNTLESLLSDSVALRMIADVPLGVFLSGGVDSSLIAALMQRNASGPIHTFTIGFEDPNFDEARHGREVAQHLGSQHDELYVTYADALALVPELPNIYDEPFADSSSIPTYLVSRLARTSATVALSGDGGDELFAGYHHHFLGARLRRRVNAVPAFARPLLGRALRTVPRTRNFGNALLEDELDPIETVMLRDFTTYLPDDILVKVDRASMAVSLEVRTPFLDHRVIEFAWSLPLSMKIRDDRGKWILRTLLRKFLPAQLVDREKQGFGLPIADWLRGPLRAWAEELLAPLTRPFATLRTTLSPQAGRGATGGGPSPRVRGEGARRADEGPFDGDHIRDLWRRHLAGENHQGDLWTVLMYQAWLRA